MTAGRSSRARPSARLLGTLAGRVERGVGRRVHSRLLFNAALLLNGFHQSFSGDCRPIFEVTLSYFFCLLTR